MGALALVLVLFATQVGALAHLATHDHALPLHEEGDAHHDNECMFLAALTQASLSPVVAPLLPAVLPARDALAAPIPPCPRVSGIALYLLAPSHSPPALSA